jgi:hypothetical protein
MRISKSSARDRIADTKKPLLREVKFAQKRLLWDTRLFGLGQEGVGFAVEFFRGGGA